jgi:hypothetical protein
MGGIAAWPHARVTRTIAFALALTLSLVLTATVRAVAPPTPWDGVNPFRCTIQDAGQGTTVPDPGADPYCVRFDKSHQNVTELGLLTFLTEEPARFGAAAPKCFYYQEDHWRGSLIQANQQTVIYEFYGHYFFNKATGDGGVWVTDFRIAGQTFDPRTLPGFPPQYDQDFGPGTGGFISHNDVPTDPNCVAQANQAPARVYARPGSRCLSVHGQLTRWRIGPVRLNATTARVRMRLGPPSSSTRGFLRYCLSAGGRLLIGRRAGDPSAQARAVFLLASSRAFRLRGRGGRSVTVGASMTELRAAFPHARTLFRLGPTTILGLAWPRDADDAQRVSGEIIAGLLRGRLAYLAVYDAQAIASNRALAAYLRRSR